LGTEAASGEPCGRVGGCVESDEAAAEIYEIWKVQIGGTTVLNESTDVIGTSLGFIGLRWNERGRENEESG
jgi:hypothetical protein